MQSQVDFEYFVYVCTMTSTFALLSISTKFSGKHPYSSYFFGSSESKNRRDETFGTDGAFSFHSMFNGRYVL